MGSLEAAPEAGTHDRAVASTDAASRERRRQRYFGRTIPRLRFLGMALLVGFAVGIPPLLGHRYPPGLALGLAILLGFGVPAIVLQPLGVRQGWRLAYEPSVIADFFWVAGFVVATGGSQSPFFWIPLLRLTDLSTYAKRLYFACVPLPAIAYSLVLAHEGYSGLALPAAEAQKVIGLGFAAMYLYSNLTVGLRARQRLLGLLSTSQRLRSDLEARNEELHRVALENERLARSKTDFLARMSHELRTPLNGVIGMIEALNRVDLDEGPRRYAKIARTSADALLVMINDVLDLSKLDVGAVELEQSAVYLRGTLEEVAEMGRSIVGERPVEVRVGIDEQLPESVLTDSTRLRQVLLNLVSNAIKFTEAGHVSVKARGEDEDLVIEVEDTGMGIESERLHLIFEPFAQAEIAVHRKFGGTGLGLAISRDLAQLMGGSLCARSTLGVGSTFVLRLPLVPAGGEEDVAPRTLASKPLPTRLRKVLLVEDSPINVAVATLLLEELELDFDVAQDGTQAVEMTGRRDYDLVLMDLNMPKMDGLEATRRIRHRDGPGTRIIALTANAFAEDREVCREAGMDDFVAKPVTLEALIEALSRMDPDEPTEG